MKTKYFLGLALMALLFAGCEKVLDKQPLDQFTNDNFWSSETNVEIYANYFYNTFTGYGNSGGSGDFYFPTLNDNQAASGFALWNYTSVPASNSTWSSCYTEIRRANIMIEKVPGIESMSESARNNWVGVARLYRAWQHYILVRNFGDCIYVEKVLDVTDEDKDGYLFAARTDRDVVMDKVLEDLNFACSNITMNASSRVAFNNALAQAMKAEICLYEGTFAKYRSTADGQKAPDSGRATSYLNAAKQACQAIMSNGMYALNGTYKSNYDSENLNSNKEMILFKHYQTGALTHSLIDYTCSSTMQSGMSKAGFESYLFLDGKPMATTSYDTNDHAVMNADGNMDISHMLAVRDGRLAQTIDAVLMYRGQSYVRYGVGMATTSSTGYGVLKFDNASYPVNFRNQTSSNYSDAPIFWLAEIYLNYAEACAELGACSQADLDMSINKLRDRAGMPHLTTTPTPDPANNMNVSDLIWEIRRERRVELMFDVRDRYWSLIRWHQLDKLDTTKYPDQVRGAWVGEANKAQATITADGYIDATNDGVRNYESKHYLNPIPSGQIDLNANLGQNPGW